MNNNDRTCRTLIISFAVAIMALVPLKFVEMGQQGYFNYNNAAVLGATTEESVAVLPNADITSIKEDSAPAIEAPYNNFGEASNCITTDDANQMISKVADLMSKKGISKEEQQSYAKVVDNIVSSRCK